MQVIFERSGQKDRETIATWRKRAIAFYRILIIIIAAFLVERPASGATNRTAFTAPEVALSVGRPTSALLSEVVAWLSENFGLVATYDHPANGRYQFSVRLLEWRSTHDRTGVQPSTIAEVPSRNGPG